MKLFYRVWVLLFFAFFTAHLHGEYYFAGTDHQLEVIRISGEKPGLTVLIFGGIHGDEPGGYFSSEVLSKIKLFKGKLIIVPRVNFPSIMMNRREINGDMNRKFGHREHPDDPDRDVVKLLKELMAEADIFINQHDAYGFHRETYISEKYNQKRYGQSLIIDAPLFFSKKLDKEINLAEIGKRILARVNEQITEETHHFGYWDHNSVSRDTSHLEMRKSATYYALTTHSIPAFGLETSKDLPSLDHKVKYQLLVIKEILHEFGLEFEFPPPGVKLPVLYWVEFLKNGKDIIRVNSHTNLRLDAGDRLVVKEIYSNYHSGLSANILDWGTINDVEKEFVFEKEAVVSIKKNNLPIGEIYLKKYNPGSVREITVNVNGEDRVIPNWGKIVLAEDEYFIITGTVPVFSNTRFDVRGYNAEPGKADDSNVKIYFSQLLTKYSFNEVGNVYFVKVYTEGRFAGGFQIEYR